MITLSIANMSIQVIPCSNTTNSDIYSLVDKGIEIIQQSGLKYLVGPLGTSVEGEMDELFTLAKNVQQAVADAGADRIVTIIKFDYAAQGVTMEEKTGKYRG